VNVVYKTKGKEVLAMFDDKKEAEYYKIFTPKTEILDTVVPTMKSLFKETYDDYIIQISRDSLVLGSLWNGVGKVVNIPKTKKRSKNNKKNNKNNKRR
jgi:hypothetical protein